MLLEIKIALPGCPRYIRKIEFCCLRLPRSVCCSYGKDVHGMRRHTSGPTAEILFFSRMPPRCGCQSSERMASEAPEVRGGSVPDVVREDLCCLRKGVQDSAPQLFHVLPEVQRHDPGLQPEVRACFSGDPRCFEAMLRLWRGIPRSPGSAVLFQHLPLSGDPPGSGASLLPSMHYV